MHDLIFTYDHAKLILHGITLEIPLSKITILAGPVGSRESTLCKALLGEIPSANGSVQFPQPIASIAFCDQTPWLPNETIRACIVGASDTDEEWYRTVLRTAELRYDLERLTNGDLTLVASNGIALSGSQKVRVALARALFARTPLLILDDVFSGLDNATENKGCEDLFGRRRLLRCRGTTVVLVSHNSRHLHFTDQTIALSSTGTVLDASSLLRLQKDPAYDGMLAVKDREENTSSSIVDENAQTSNIVPSVPIYEAADSSRQTGDFTIYRYSFSLFGRPYILFLLLTWSAVGFFFNFNTVWLKFWSDHNIANPEENRKAYYLGVYAVIQI